MGRGLQPDCGGPGAHRVPLVPTTSQPKQRHFGLLDKHLSPVALGKWKEDVQQPGPNTQHPLTRPAPMAKPQHPGLQSQPQSLPCHPHPQAGNGAAGGRAALAEGPQLGFHSSLNFSFSNARPSSCAPAWLLPGQEGPHPASAKPRGGRSQTAAPRSVFRRGARATARLRAAAPAQLLGRAKRRQLSVKAKLGSPNPQHGVWSFTGSDLRV